MLVWLMELGLPGGAGCCPLARNHLPAYSERSLWAKDSTVSLRRAFGAVQLRSAFSASVMLIGSLYIKPQRRRVMDSHGHPIDLGGRAGFARIDPGRQHCSHSRRSIPKTGKEASWKSTVPPPASCSGTSEAKKKAVLIGRLVQA